MRLASRLVSYLLFWIWVYKLSCCEHVQQKNKTTFWHPTWSVCCFLRGSCHQMLTCFQTLSEQLTLGFSRNIGTDVWLTHGKSVPQSFSTDPKLSFSRGWGGWLADVRFKSQVNMSVCCSGFVFLRRYHAAENQIHRWAGLQKSPLGFMSSWYSVWHREYPVYTHTYTHSYAQRASYIIYPAVRKY